MSAEHILIAATPIEIGKTLARSILEPAGFTVTLIEDPSQALELVKRSTFDLAILSQDGAQGAAGELAFQLSEQSPTLPILLICPPDNSGASMSKNGVWEVLNPPVSASVVLAAVRRTLDRSNRCKEGFSQEIKRALHVLQRRLDTLQALQMVGRSVTSLLNLDEVLSAVVDAAVDMTGAEEGSLLLLDEASGELYMRAARNFQDDFVRRFRLPIRDSLAGQVMRTGKPLLINTQQPQKIKTAYLVHTLIYVPLTVHNRVIGVLGVDNRNSGHPFKEEDLGILTSLAENAAIAVENARSFAASDQERKKLHTILSRLEDGVIILDPEGRIILANQSVCSLFGLTPDGLVGKLFKDHFTHPDLLDLLEARQPGPRHSELTLDDGRVFNLQVSPIPEVGLGITLQDITHLKELDRIKSDFVTTVSHDLRSPLTAILGYVDLIERLGTVNEQQQEFIRRIQVNVINITTLINDLLDLGRIEAGFDVRKEVVPLDEVIRLAVEQVVDQAYQRQIRLEQEIESPLPAVLGVSARLKQMLVNLLGNAIKFSPPGSMVMVRARMEADQAILQVQDHGAGIPLADQPFIFDRFYRASNAPADSTGSGLGLAIVKSIVESHAGRIWVDSLPGRGATFTVVLPIAQPAL